MNSPWLELTTCGLAYLAGSIPFGLLVARGVAGIDIRKVGSGNIGATNIGRVLGMKWGVTVLVLDAFKGFLPVWLIPLSLTAGQGDVASGTLQVIAGVATVVGHMFPIWLKFKGGKGVATALGVVLCLAPGASLAGLAGFGLCMLASRIVALSSMTAAVAFAIGQIAILWPNPFNGEKLPLAVFSLAVPALIVLRHRSNIKRLLRGEEQQFQFGSSQPEAAAEPDSPTEAEESGETSASPWG
jgi:glycerol-3-phosphate acyltransferase PlsY